MKKILILFVLFIIGCGEKAPETVTDRVQDLKFMGKSAVLVRNPSPIDCQKSFSPHSDRESLIACHRYYFDGGLGDTLVLTEVRYNNVKQASKACLGMSFPEEICLENTRLLINGLRGYQPSWIQLRKMLEGIARGAEQIKYPLFPIKNRVSKGKTAPFSLEIEAGVEELLVCKNYLTSSKPYSLCRNLNKISSPKIEKWLDDNAFSKSDSEFYFKVEDSFCYYAHIEEDGLLLLKSRMTKDEAIEIFRAVIALQRVEK